MSRRVTVELGYPGDTRDVTVEIPDGEPVPWQVPDRFELVGRSTPRVDGAMKATGAARYSYDIVLPEMLYGAILRSPHPAARVRSVDLSAARRLPGVRAAIEIGNDQARFAGQEIAAVAADSSDIADDAIALIKVDYEPRRFAVTIADAAASGAPSVFSGSNLDKPKISSKGDVDRALASAAEKIEATYVTPVQTHVSLETHGAVARFDESGLTVWCSTQGIFSVRDDLAVYFNLPPEKVRVICEYLGGGFGSKFGARPEIVTAARLAKEAGAPVKLMLPRGDEHLATGNRPNAEQTVRLGADRSGKLVAIDLVQRGSGGVGGGSGSSGPFKMVYPCDNIRTSETNVYMNAGPASPMRAPGWPQGCFGLEMAMDELARSLHIDRLEFRRVNNTNPVRAHELDLGARAFRWDDTKSALAKQTGTNRRGIGVACAAWHALGASGPEATAIAHRDGHVEIRCGTQDIGTGTRTALAIVAAEELGVPISQVASEIGDTRYPFSLPSGGSMSAPSNTPAVRQAAAHLRDKLFRIAAPILGAAPSDLEARDAVIRVRFDPSRSVAFKTVCRRIPGDSISAQGERLPNYQEFRPDQAGCQFAEVEVDTETGITRVVRVVAVHDVGTMLDPLTSRSQVNGGVLMGISYALFEMRRMDPALGLMMNPTMDDYKLVGPLDTPKIDVIFLDVRNGGTNTGVLGIGEVVHVASTAAVACAVSDAIGVPIRELPLTPDRILAALEHA